MTGIYIHVPFCVRKCPYCDFFSVAYTEGLADAYTAAILRAIATQPYGTLRAGTLYLGGGTPILLGAERLGRILAACREAFGLGEGSEITLEANPAATMGDTLEALREAGFNRISFGVQSLEDGELTALGRLHSAAEARQAILDAAAAGFRDISADLMLGIPGQTGESLAATLGGLCALPVNHISAYLLKIEEGTPFWAQKSALSLPGEDAAADRYLECVEGLEARGFAQYEISNFAREGRVARHNLNYWQCGEYLGIGPAAHSHLRGGRFYFPRDLAGFLAAEAPFALTVADGDGGGEEERLLLGLRLTGGIDGAPYPALLQKAAELAGHGLVRVAGSNVALTVEGFLLSNAVIGALLGVLG